MAEHYYEMLWDCSQCATHGLLGKAHRHCPMCGAAQDPGKRYFPEEGKEVEAVGHQYVGADWRCSYCEAPNAAAAAFCVECGGPKEGAKTVQSVSDAPTHSPAQSVPDIKQTTPPQLTPKPSGVPWLKIVLALALVAIALLATLFFRKHDEQVQITEKTWSREVDVEQFTAVRTSDWCNAMPANAYQVSRSREQRGTRQVADGQDCREVRTDMADGTFTKRRECTPRYRDEPVFDDKCSYRINRWQVLRTARSDGAADLAPSWPAPVFGNNALPGEVLGAERLGSRRESYRVQLTSTQGQTWQCGLPFADWSALQEQQRLTLKVRGTGGADCDSLVAKR